MYELKNNGITLIALVITIIVLLILARSKFSNANRIKWNTNASTKSKEWNRRSTERRTKYIR